MKLHFRKLGWALAVAVLLVGFQNCAETEFADNDPNDHLNRALNVSDISEEPGVSCVETGEAPFQSGSLIGSGYNFCATNPSEIAGISQGLIISVSAPQSVHSAYRAIAGNCCSQEMRVTAVASGCLNGMFAVRCM